MGKAFKLDNEVLSSSISSLQTSLNNHAGVQASGSAFGHVKTGTGIGVSGGVISVNYGTAAGTACQGNDSRLSNSRTPNAHASTSTNYGAGTASNFGHVKVSDNYTSSAGAAADAVAASSKAVYDAYTALKNSFQGGVDTIYNAFVNAGTTPSAKTPAAIETAVTTLKNNSYNSGYSSGRTQGQNDVKNSPNSYSLYTKSQYDNNYNSGRTQGQNDVKNSPNSYSLYTKTQYDNNYNSGYSAGKNSSKNFTIEFQNQIYTNINGNTAKPTAMWKYQIQCVDGVCTVTKLSGNECKAYDTSGKLLSATVLKQYQVNSITFD